MYNQRRMERGRDGETDNKVLLGLVGDTIAQGRRPPDFLLVQKNFLYCLIFPEDFTRGSGRIYKSNYTSRIIELVKEELFGLALVEAI